MMNLHNKSIVVVLLQFVMIVTVQAGQQPGTSFKTEGAFQKALDLRVTASWKNIELRQMLRRLSEDRKVAVILDGRVDPNQKLSFEATNLPLRKTFKSIATTVETKTSIIGNTIYTGPSIATNKLRTLIALRHQELSESATLNVSKDRKRKLLSRSTISWDDLTPPRQLLLGIAKRQHLKVTGVDKIRHDLWAKATLPKVNVCEALSLILIQSNHTFAWSNNGNEIEIVDIPAKVVITQSHLLRRKSAQRMLKTCQSKMPGIPIILKGTRLSVTGTAEQQEEIDAILHPGKYKNGTTDTTEVLPLKRRLFTLKIKNVPASALMNKLKQSGIQFQYDATLFRKKGINFNKTISLDVKQVKSEQFFSAIFRQLNIKFKIDGTTVTLQLK